MVFDPSSAIVPAVLQSTYQHVFSPQRDEGGRLKEEYLQKLENYLKEFAEPPSYNIGNIILGALGGALAGNLAGIGTDVLLGNQRLDTFYPDPSNRPSLLPLLGLLGGGGLGALLGYLKKPSNEDAPRYKNFLEQSRLYRQNKLDLEGQNKFEKELKDILKERFGVSDDGNFSASNLFKILAIVSGALGGALLGFPVGKFIGSRTRLPIW
jgi:hypothetical protein